MGRVNNSGGGAALAGRGAVTCGGRYGRDEIQVQERVELLGPKMGLEIS